MPEGNEKNVMGKLCMIENNVLKIDQKNPA